MTFLGMGYSSPTCIEPKSTLLPFQSLDPNNTSSISSREHSNAACVIVARTVEYPQRHPSNVWLVFPYAAPDPNMRLNKSHERPVWRILARSTFVQCQNTVETPIRVNKVIARRLSVFDIRQAVGRFRQLDTLQILGGPSNCHQSSMARVL